MIIFNEDDIRKLRLMYVDKSNTLFSKNTSTFTPEDIYRTYGFHHGYYILCDLLPHKKQQTLFKPFFDTIITNMIGIINDHHSNLNQTLPTLTLEELWKARTTSPIHSALFAHTYLSTLLQHLNKPDKDFYKDLDVYGYRNDHRKHDYSYFVKAAYAMLDTAKNGAFFQHNPVFVALEENPKTATGNTYYPEMYVGESMISIKTLEMLFKETIISVPTSKEYS